MSDTEHTGIHRTKIMATVREWLDTSSTTSETVTKESQMLYCYLYRIGVKRPDCWHAAEMYRQGTDRQRPRMLQVFGIGGVDELESLVDTELQEK